MKKKKKKKKKGIVIGTCKVCLIDNLPLIGESHIIPKFIYRATKTFKASRIPFEIKHDRIGEPAKSANVIYKRTGAYERFIFCKECETRLSKLETYAASIWSELSNLETKMLSPDGAVFQRHIRVDYSKFKLFFVSVFWRAAISPRITSLPEEEVEATELFRQMLMENNPKSEDEYPIVVKLMEPVLKNRSFLVQPFFTFLGSAIMIANEVFIELFLTHVSPFDVDDGKDMRYRLREDGYLLIEVSPEWQTAKIYKSLNLSQPQDVMLSKDFKKFFT
jgi:hypothetical protein